MATRLPPPRRIVTSNLSLPASVAGLKNPEPVVEVLVQDVAQLQELDGDAFRGTVFTHEAVPTNNDGSDVTPREPSSHGIVFPTGANIRYNDVAPGKCVPMHRTQSTDYNIFLNGEVYLITPAEAGAGDSTLKLKETLCRPGDVVCQRGTLHSWENRSSEWVRWIVVILGAEPTTVEVEGKDEKIQIKDFFGKYGSDDIWEGLVEK
ncbi:hypothetical protein BP6252_05992 [Coleophoma cylindrospora]|uniref:Cupin 2 conserved barrel domain-containing protein n=1 Tax=Coleophoma cylindrospora TaxID=1849047 RepID=A0A3D8RLM3_9HELO|nr:hypothetical protein BP6252_05992 [Coleophoma cylindrospora]